MTDYSTDGEFVELGKSGLDWKDCAGDAHDQSVRTHGRLRRKGTVTPGKLADLTILDADPADDLTNFARVHAVVRSGQGGLAAKAAANRGRPMPYTEDCASRRLPACRKLVFMRIWL